jgi:hypothetical protein
VKKYLLVLMLVSFILPGLSFADGCYIPVQAIKKIPEIPSQRALLVWKDGKETLIISSALDSKSQELGWIIPLPSVPEQMEKTSSGALKTLNFCIQPKITHDLGEESKTLTIFVVIIMLTIFTSIFKPGRVMELLAIFVVLFIFAGMLLPHLAISRVKMANKSNMVIVEKAARVGAYDISVLRAQKADDLNKWLVSNNFAELPAAGIPIVDDYIKNKWVFVTIKLTRHEAGLNAPHPIKLLFDSAKAVYPMQLTSLAGGKPAFELFILGNKRAFSELLKTEYCSKFNKNLIEKMRDKEYESKYLYKSIEDNQDIGVKAVCDLMWNECVLTKLSGTIDSKKMNHDIYIKWNDYKPYREHYYTSSGAKTFAYMICISVVGVFSLLTLLIFRKKSKKAGFGKFYFIKVLLPGTLVAVLISIIIYFCLPKLNASDANFTHPILSRLYQGDLSCYIKTLFAEHPELSQQSEKEITSQIFEFLRKEFLYRQNMRKNAKAKTIRNEISGGILKVDDTPGNFTVNKTDDAVIIRFYDRIGAAMLQAYKINKDKIKKPML